MDGTTTQVEKSGGGSIPAQRVNTARRANTASISISGWPDQVEPEQLIEIFKEWGVNLELGSVNFEWFFSTEAEGYTLKVQLSDLAKARELLELRDKKDFEFGIGEITAAQQSRLRLIATSPREDAAAYRARYPKPNTQNILSETQLTEIKRSVSNPPTGNQQPKGMERTILGKTVPPPVPTPPSNTTNSDWKEVENRKSKKSQAGQPKNNSPQEHKGQGSNVFTILEEQESEDMEEEDNTSKEQEQEEKEERKEETSEERSRKHTEAAAAKAAKAASQKKLADLKRQLKGHKLWGKETSLIVDKYVEKIMGLGIDVANDTMENLLENPPQEIKKRINAGISGEIPSIEKDSSSETTDILPQAPTTGTEDFQTQKEETKVAQEEKTQQTSDSKVNPTSNEDPVVGAGLNQGMGNEAFPSPYPDPPTPVPPVVHKEDPPNTESAGTMHAPVNLSPNGMPPKTITGYFSRTDKATRNPAPPSLSQ